MPNDERVFYAGIFEGNIIVILTDAGSFYLYHLTDHVHLKNSLSTGPETIRSTQHILSDVISFLGQNPQNSSEIPFNYFSYLDEESTLEATIADDFCLKKVYEGFNTSSMISWSDKYNRASSKLRYFKCIDSQITILSIEGYCKFEMMNWALFMTSCLKANKFIYCIKKLHQILSGN